MTTANNRSPDVVTRDAAELPGDPSPCVPYVAAATVSGAQRQRAYRQRQKRAAIDAIGNEAAASRATLLALLAHELAALDDRSTPKTSAGPARNMARRILNELVTRYAIEL